MRIKHLLIAIPVILFITACGGGGSGEESSNNESIILEQNSSIVVRSGDSLNPLTEDTLIEVTHTINDETKEVKILQGSAEFIKGNSEISN